MFRSIQSSLSCVASVAVSAVRGVRGAAPARSALPSQSQPLPDRLFQTIELEYRGHDRAVLKSYTQFLEAACSGLAIRQGAIEVLPYVRWVQPLLRSKFVHKKYKLHYETRTHITRFKVHDLTGSTASAFLEYIERNVPEGVGMRVEYEEMLPLPDTITKMKIEETRRANEMEEKTNEEQRRTVENEERTDEPEVQNSENRQPV